jgi:hypothetical protein
MRIRDKVVLFEFYLENEWLETHFPDARPITHRYLAYGTYAAHRHLCENNVITCHFKGYKKSGNEYNYKLTTKGSLIFTGLKREFKLMHQELTCHKLKTLKIRGLKPVTTSDLPAMVKKYRQLQSTIDLNESN